MWGAEQWPGASTSLASFPGQEKTYYEQLFRRYAGPGDSIDGARLMELLQRSRLDKNVLKTIWDLADTGKRGPQRLRLSDAEFAQVMRLVAHAQAGCVVSSELTQMAPAAMPQFDEPPVSAARRGRSPGRPSGERLLPSARDLRKYGRLFCRTVGRGDVGSMMTADAAGDVLRRSGQQNEVLQRVWELADADRDAQLSWPEFVVAMHALRAANLALGSGGMDAALRAVDALSSAVQGPEWQAGLRALEPAQVYASAPSSSPRSASAVSSAVSLKSSRSGSSRRGQDRPLPTARDLRKYGRLFRGLVGPDRPVVTAEEARALFNRSELPEGALGQIWAFADRDQDGSLNWPEFVLAMHLTRRARSSAMAPVLEPPSDLIEYLGTIESAHTYASQASSRSTSPAADAFAQQTSPWTDASQPSWTGASQAPWTSTPPPTGDSAFPGSSAPAADVEFPVPGSPAHSPEIGSLPDVPPKATHKHHGASKDQKSKRHHHRHRPAELLTESAAEGPLGTGRYTESNGIDTPNFEDRSRDRGRSSPQGYMPNGGASSPSRDAQPVEHLEVLIEADKRLAQKLRMDIDALDEELNRLEESCVLEEKQTARERAECQRIGEERQHLLQQLEASRRQLVNLKSEHQGLHAECVSLQRSNGHYGREAAFLKRLFDDCVRDAQSLQQSIEYLEMSQNSLVQHTKSLEEAQREVAVQARSEEEQLERERQEAARAKQALEALRGTGNVELPGVARILGTAAGGSSLQPSPGSEGGGGVQRPRSKESATASPSGDAQAPPPWHFGVGGGFGGRASGSGVNDDGGRGLGFGATVNNGVRVAPGVAREGV